MRWFLFHFHALFSSPVFSWVSSVLVDICETRLVKLIASLMEERSDPKQDFLFFLNQIATTRQAVKTIAIPKPIPNRVLKVVEESEIMSHDINNVFKSS